MYDRPWKEITFLLKPLHQTPFIIPKQDFDSAGWAPWIIVDQMVDRTPTKLMFLKLKNAFLRRTMIYDSYNIIPLNLDVQSQ